MAARHTITRRGFVTTIGVTGAAALAGKAAPAAGSPSVTLALLGAAHMHTPMFLQMLKSREDVKVACVWDHDAARAERYAKECGAKVARSVAEAIGEARISGVVILSETSLHLELATAAAKAKKHLFIEKPLGVAAKDASQIADAVEKAGVHFTTGYHLRTIPKHLFIKENIEKGNLGRIVRVQCSFCNDCVLQGAFDDNLKWTVDRKWGALGGFADTGTHALDMLMWLMGDVEAVMADIRTVTNRHPNCDETGQGMIRFKNGVTGTISAGWVEPENPVGLLVAGTEGHAAVFNDRLYLRTKKVPGADGARPWGKLPAGPDHPLLQLVSAIAGAKDAPLVTAREAAMRVKVMEAMYLSARERKWVTVE
jgi:1,5-anhydro-D-fructose reductase (1,5-anhydro-D-mannitol-forming)